MARPDHPEAPQIRQHRSERRRRQVIPIARRPTGSHELLRHLRGQCSRGHPLLGQPPAQLGDDPQLLLHRRSRIAQPRQLGSALLRVWLQRACEADPFHDDHAFSSSDDEEKTLPQPAGIMPTSKARDPPPHRPARQPGRPRRHNPEVGLMAVMPMSA